MNSKHIEWIDVAKGIGMLLVMLGHFGCGSWIRNIIYSFHMPLFFFMAGYVYKDNGNIHDFLNSRLKKIVVPYYMLGLVMLAFYVIHGIVIGNIAGEKLLSVALNFLLARRQWTIWFLATLLSVGLLQFTLSNYIKKFALKAIIVIACPILGLVYYVCGGVALPWNLDICLMAIPFFYMGNCFRKYNLVDKNVLPKLRWIVLGVVLGTACIIFMMINQKLGGGGLDMSRSSYGILPITYCAALAGTMSVICFAHAFTSVGMLRYIGENSMLFMAWHQTICQALYNDIILLSGWTINNASIIRIR